MRNKNFVTVVLPPGVNARDVRIATFVTTKYVVVLLVVSVYLAGLWTTQIGFGGVAKIKDITPLKPPGVKRSPNPILFNGKPPKEYLDKTLKDKVDVWFKIRSFKFQGVEQYLWYIDWDAERKPFDTIVIHHSATTPNATAEEIESYNKRVYERRYTFDETQPGGDDPYVKGLKIVPNHVIISLEDEKKSETIRLTKDRFIAYHHLVYETGRVTTELQPLIKRNNQWLIDMVGWHAGNWPVNCQSIAICLVGNFQTQEPSLKQLEATAGLIRHYVQFNPKLKIEPHRSIARTDCPGQSWERWRTKLE